MTPLPEPPPPTQHPVSLKDLDAKPEDRAKVLKMKCPELRDALRAKGLSVDGLKETLQARLLNPTPHDVAAEEEDGSDRDDVPQARAMERGGGAPGSTPSSPRRASPTERARRGSSASTATSRVWKIV